jgi:hypothetical protein
MPTNKRSWRLIPSPYVERHVERMAREENRSLSNMCETLLRAAIHQKLQAQAYSAERDALVSAIRGTDQRRPN